MNIFTRALAPLLLGAAACAAEPARDFTNFQTGDGYFPEIDAASDVAIVYGADDLEKRVASWRAQGYNIGFMAGIAWGAYSDYFGDAEHLKKDEIQTRKNGRLWMHGDSRRIGYNVPTPAYVEYLKKKFEPVVDLGVPAVFMEEPEYWAEAGWSEAFKQAWQRFYNEPWREPDSSVDAQYRASRLKYELYFDALSGVFKHLKARAKAQGRGIECHVATHSLINYAHWRIVSPESHLMDLPEADGYIAQVWTGTARTPNLYKGVRKERTFESAFFEYGQALGMVRPTGRKVWFLADPVEDNPNHTWADYRLNYEATITASLFWPEVHRYEVMPWPSRIFRGSYPKSELDKSSGQEGIPADYATELLTVFNALNDMKQDDVKWSCAAQGIGIVVSDTMMFQRAAPKPSDPHLSSFYGLALPLLKAGIPAEPVQLETILTPHALDRYKILVLTYEGQKPLKPEYHAALDAWVRGGGGLLYVGDGSDPYNAVREWWNHNGTDSGTPSDDLFQRLGLRNDARHKAAAVDKGFARILFEKARELAKYPEGAASVLGGVEELLRCNGASLTPQNRLVLQRGPYVVAAVLDEAASAEPLRLEGRYVDCFDPGLRILKDPAFNPGARALLYQLSWRMSGVPRVVAAAARVRDVRADAKRLQFTARGPAGTRCRLRVQCPGQPDRIALQPEQPVESTWDAESATLLLAFDNRGADAAVTLEY